MYSVGIVHSFTNYIYIRLNKAENQNIHLGVQRLV